MLLAAAIRKHANDLSHLSIGRLVIPVHHIVVIAECEAAVQRHRLSLLSTHCTRRLTDLVRISGSCRKEEKQDLAAAIAAKKAVTKIQVLTQKTKWGKAQSCSLLTSFPNLLPRAPATGLVRSLPRWMKAANVHNTASSLDCILGVLPA